MTTISNPLKQFVNFALFQAVWLTTILTVANGWPWVGLAALAGYCAVHARISPTARADFMTALALLPIGLGVETGYVALDLIDYKFAPANDFFPPPWIIWLWANLALTLNNCLGWLHGRPWLAAGGGLLAGPLTYFAGARLGAAALGQSELIAVVAFAGSWALLVPLLMSIARYFRDRTAVSARMTGV